MSVASQPSTKPASALPAPLDVARLRADFPELSVLTRGKPLVYLDNGNTTQKPRAVIDATDRYYSSQNANIHRGNYELSQTATELYDQARRKVRRFINAAEDRQIIFTRGTTEGINLVASSFGRKFIGRGDEILVSAMEHHSNIVPWQIIAEQTGAVLRVIPMNDAGELELDEFSKMLSPRTRIVAVVHLSNSLGTINDVRTITRLAHDAGAKVLIDGAQWAAHHATDVRAIDCDFYVFSGHKAYGPTGIGVLYGKTAVLEEMPPYQGGGDMIREVTFAKTTYAELPFKFEAGTPNIAGAIGLGAAIDYLGALGMDRIVEYEQSLFDYAMRALGEVPGVRFVGTARQHGGVISLVLRDQHPHDVGTLLDMQGIAVRTGHHCCQPVMDRFGLPATVRVSLGMYNTTGEVDTLVAALNQIVATAPPKPTVASASATGRSNVGGNGAAGAFLAGGKASASPQAAAEELIEAFELLGDWDQRLAYLLDLGTKLPPLPNELRTEPNRVHGCQSTVFLASRPVPGDGSPRLLFLADSDAHIVRGLIAVLRRVFNGQKAAEITAFDIENLFHNLGLDQHLSMGRRNGLSSMIKRMKSEAVALDPRGGGGAP
jgi:cysteine desulfurase / selenocysteine lyase